MEIPLTSFMDFVTKSGSPKLTCARKIKEQLGVPYDPTFDYYRRFREAVIELHKKGLDKKELTRLVGPLPIAKTGNYNNMVNAYKAFLGSKKITSFNPPRANWVYGDLTIPVNPEIALSWGGQLYVIKLYLKADKLSKDRIEGVLALMNLTLPKSQHQYALLDVRNSKLYQFEDDMMALLPLVEAEAMALMSILDKL